MGGRERQGRKGEVREWRGSGEGEGREGGRGEGRVGGLPDTIQGRSRTTPGQALYLQDQLVSLALNAVP